MMDLTALAGILKPVSSVLGGMVAGPAGAAIGPLIITTLAQAFGVDPTPEAVAKKIEADPAKAQTVIRQVEEVHAKGWSELEARLADVQSARSQTLNLVKADSAIAWGAPVISTLIVLGFLTLTGAVLFRTVPADNQAVLILFGTLSTAFGSVVSYWLGSSSGSKDKDTLLAMLASSAQPAKKAGR